MGSLKVILFQYARDIWRRRWYAVGVAWAICLVGWVIVSRMPDIYESNARVYMNADEALTPLLRGLAVESDVDARLERMQRTLLSGTNMKKLIRMTDLDSRVKDSADREAMVARLQKAIVIKLQTRNLFTVTYSDTDPQLAQSVVSNVLSLFMESSAGDSRTDIDSAQRFLQTEIDRLETQLREAERKKSEFQTRYYDLLPNGETGGSRLEGSRAEVQKITEDLNDSIAERDSLHKQLDAQQQYDSVDKPASAPSGNEGLSTAPQTRLAQLRTQLETAKSTLTDQHPVVIALKHQIAAVQSEIAKTVVHTKAGPTSQNIANPVYIEMAGQLSAKETKIASLRRRLVSAEEDRDKIEDEARRAPSVGAEYLNLDRDYEVVKKNYTELLARRESAQIAENADKKGDKIDIKTIDTPEVPSLPSSPNRPLFLSMVLVAGLGAGIGVAFVLSQIDTSYSTTTALQALGLPILGSISIINSFDRRPRHWFLSAKVFVAACVMLVVIYGGLLLAFLGAHHKGA
ncbi:MAG: exosortase [Rhodospirillales bacterium]|nr:exosortase [Rhodospirillales bacterium]